MRVAIEPSYSSRQLVLSVVAVARQIRSVVAGRRRLDGCELQVRADPHGSGRVVVAQRNVHGTLVAWVGWRAQRKSGEEGKD
jgi:hypothetical protein